MRVNGDVFFWATVQSVSPLTVRRDGETAPMGVAPSVLVDPEWLQVGDRVWCQLHHRRALVLGVAGGVRRIGPWRPMQLSTDHDWSGTAEYRRVERGIELYIHVSAPSTASGPTLVAGFPVSSGITLTDSWYGQGAGSGGNVGTFYSVASTSSRFFIANHSNRYLRVMTVVPDRCLDGI